jgi:hypothetical protein
MTPPAVCANNLNADWTGDLVGNNDVTVHQGKYETYKKHFIGGLYPPVASKNSPYFMGYYHADEPTDPTYNQLLSEYNRLRASDPNHIVMVGIWQNYPKWQAVADVVIAGMYPYKQNFIEDENPGGRDSCNYIFEHLYAVTLGVSDFNAGSKPLYPVIQALGKTDEAEVYVISEDELRALTYSCICMDVKGLSYYLYDMKVGFGDIRGGMGLSDNPTVLAYYKKSVTELKSLSNIFLMPTIDYEWHFRTGSRVSISPNLTWDLWGRTYKNFKWILKGDATGTYLIVVNKDVRSISNVTITINNMSGTKTVRTIGNYTTGTGRTGRTLTINNGVFSEPLFDGLAVHIYQIGDAITCPPMSITMTM